MKTNTLLAGAVAIVMSCFSTGANADGFFVATPIQDLQCPTYEEGQQQRSCILTGLDQCRMDHPDCESQAFVLTTNDVSARVQDLCCGQETTTARNKCFKKRLREIKKAKSLAPLYRESLRKTIKGYLTSDTVCGEE